MFPVPHDNLISLVGARNQCDVQIKDIFSKSTKHLWFSCFLLKQSIKIILLDGMHGMVDFSCREFEWK